LGVSGQLAMIPTQTRAHCKAWLCYTIRLLLL